MRRALAYLLAPLTRWLDRRIDARIAADLERLRHVESAVMTKLARSIAPASSVGLGDLTSEAAQDIRAVSSRWMGA